MAAIAGRKADIYIVSGTGAGTSFTGEACSAVSGSGNTVYQITNATKRYWSTATVPTVLVDGAAPAVRYQVGYAGGVIVFESAVTGVVTVSGAYLSTSKLGEGKEWSLDVSTTTSDDSSFGDTWKTHVITKRSGSGSLGRWWVDEYFLTEIANPLLLVLYLDQPAGTRIEMLARLTADAVKAATGDLISESLNFTVDGPISYNLT